LIITVGGTGASGRAGLGTFTTSRPKRDWLFAGGHAEACPSAGLLRRHPRAMVT